MDTQTRFLVGVSFLFITIAILLSWTVEYYVLSSQYQQLNDAAQVGVIYGTRCDCSPQDVEKIIRSSSNYPVNLDSQDVRVEIKTGIHNSCESNGMEIHIQYDHPVSAPLVSRIVNGSYVILDGVSRSSDFNPNCQ